MEDGQEVKTPFTVRTKTYEGPLELLLDLVEKRKLLVNEIALASVTDDFITYVKEAEVFPMALAADFISVAATLLLIKSKSLLPELELTSEEEHDVEDLERRLKLYARVRALSLSLGKIYGASPLYPEGERTPEIYFAPGPNLSSELLLSSLKTALQSREQTEELPEVRVRPLVSIEDMMDTLAERVTRALTLSFKEFTGNTTEKVEVIVSFLALLELVKQGTVDALQYGSFNDIQITNMSHSVPGY